MSNTVETLSLQSNKVGTLEAWDKEDANQPKYYPWNGD